MVRLTHGQWRGIVDKRGAAFAGTLDAVRTTIERPTMIHADSEDRRTFLYYAQPPAGRGKLMLAAVKCLPWRFRDGRRQRIYSGVGSLSGEVHLGEAWVTSAYWISAPKRRGTHVWP